jgi:hypothetical protein
MKYKDVNEGVLLTNNRIPIPTAVKQFTTRPR